MAKLYAENVRSHGKVHRVLPWWPRQKHRRTFCGWTIKQSVSRVYFTKYDGSQTTAPELLCRKCFRKRVVTSESRQEDKQDKIEPASQ